ncbi:hypothetical protein HXX76_011612 [Chlamydomonas incerta]|uniref:Uncharacterized protein n=1 Tax=Chlamydomonas incerta TaxID=51695 RepID=A0A835SXU6_CHLIN|nr:hypothetical protein HXX76_011612 [Chlamydomonas incerta]|eukprot:KAG2428495.1 hypothetical protein HXX76_011612 [Chlamydomonas incerta]
MAYAVQRVLLVWQESPVLLEHFFEPTQIDWRLTPDLGIDLRKEVVGSARHYNFGADSRNPMRHEVLKGTFQQLPDRVITASTNWGAEDPVGGPVPDLSQHTPLMGQLARALFRLSPAVEAATDAALASVGVQPGQPYVALHLRLGGQIGEEFAIQRFSLGQPHEVLQVASECAAGLVEEDKRRLRHAAVAAAVLAPTQAAAALAAVTESESHMPHVLLTDNDELRRRVAAGELPPWVSPELHPVHLRLRRIPGADNASAAAAGAPPAALSPAEMAAVVKAHVTSLADFGILVRARCVVLSPSGFSLQAQLLGNQACAATLGRDDRSGVEPCPGTERGWGWCSEPDCWLPEYVEWHRAHRGRPDAKYLVWVCYRDDGLNGRDAAARNVWGDCAGLGDRLRGIQYLARIAYGAKRVLLVWQESPVPLKHFFEPTQIDWRLTPDLGIDLLKEVAHSAAHYVVGAEHGNALKQEIGQGTFQQLPDRVVTVSTNWLAEDPVGGPVPDLSQHTPLMGQLARALFRLSPAVEAATDAALASVGVQPGQPYVALHLRLGGQIGEEFAIQRFSLGQPHEVLQVASECAAGLVEEDKRRLRHAAVAAAVLAPTQAAAAALAAVTESESHMPHVLLTDNDELRRRVAAGELPPWVSPELHPVHLRLQRLPGAGNASAAAAGALPAALSPAEMAAVVKAHVTSLADFGILVRARCVVLSPSGFSLQAQLLGNQACAATLGRDDRSGVEPCPGTERGWGWWWGQWWCRLVGGCGKKAGSGQRSVATM